MRLFESNNIWKKRERQRRRAASPNAEWEDWKRKKDSNILWLAGAAVLILLYVIAICKGFVPLDMGTVILLAVIGCYCAISLAGLKKHMDSEPENKSR